ncbi:MAG: TetR/AcrR family transcriptional regulator [Piscinibacter sp.]|nr:TetR/AcrR family transcriptional regulator [Piscinibacter sp.]
MPRPSRHLDQALLASGRALYPKLGSAGLSVRAVAEHAGVNAGMFHYHFDSKEGFLRHLLQQLYEDVFARLAAEVAQPGAPLARLRQALLVVGRFMREHGALIGRVWSDAGAGEPVAREFVRANAPRHVGLLLGLLDEAERAGEIEAQPPLRRLSFVMGAVVAPVLVAQRIAAAKLVPRALGSLVEPQVLSDAAIAARAEMAIAALRHPVLETDHA